MPATASMAVSLTHQSVSWVAVCTSDFSPFGSFRRPSTVTANRRMTSRGSASNGTMWAVSRWPPNSTRASITRSRTHQSSSRRTPISFGQSCWSGSGTLRMISVAMRRTFTSRLRSSQITVRETSSLPSIESCLRTSAARLLTGICLCANASTRGGSTASVPIASRTPRTASRMTRGPARILRSRAAMTRVELNRRRPSTAAFTIPTVSESRKMPTYSNQSSSVDSAEKERRAWITTGSCSFCASSSGARVLSAAAGSFPIKAALPRCFSAWIFSAGVPTWSAACSAGIA